MAQVWTMRGLHPAATPDDPLFVMMAALEEEGFPAVVATACEQTDHRYLRLGEEGAVRPRLAEVAGPKKTALGEGWFVTTESTWFVGDEPVATMMFRVLRFKPGPAATPATEPDPAVLRPVVSRDTAFFWAGTAAGELRIQRCGKC